MEDQQNNGPSHDPLAHFLFGPPRTRKDEIEHLPEQNEDPPENRVDLTEMMIHFDTLMESVSNLKPLLTKIQPIINLVWKSK